MQRRKLDAGAAVDVPQSRAWAIVRATGKVMQWGGLNAFESDAIEMGFDKSDAWRPGEKVLPSLERLYVRILLVKGSQVERQVTGAVKAEYESSFRGWMGTLR
jgi:hypothetical protein